MLSFQEIRTWSDLKKALQQATDQQLAQPVQVVKGHPVLEYVYELQHGIVVGTVDDVGLLYARSVTDNRRHGEHLVIYTDGNPFGEDGAIAYEYDSTAEKNSLGLRHKPIYGEDHEPGQDWTGPAQQLVDKQNLQLDEERINTAVIRHRVENSDRQSGNKKR